jgi:hypothetical protein
VIIFFAIWTRAFIGSMKNFNKGEVYYRDKQYIKAITFFDRSMHWYTPFNTYIERSAEYLWEIGNQAEEVNDEQLSLIALETIRNSFYSSRSFYSPGTGWIKRCEDKISDLVKNKNGEIFQGNDSKNNDRLYEQKMAYNDPIILWTLILEIGLFGWIGSIIGFIFFYLGTDIKINKYISTYWLWIILLVFNYGLWIIGMIKA